MTSIQPHALTFGNISHVTNPDAMPLKELKKRVAPLLTSKKPVQPEDLLVLRPSSTESIVIDPRVDQPNVLILNTPFEPTQTGYKQAHNRLDTSELNATEVHQQRKDIDGAFAKASEQFITLKG